MRWEWNTHLLKSGSISLKIFYLVFINIFLFFVLGVFFDGGAFPWGEIRGERFLIVNNQGIRDVAKNWFWLTYWQGLSAWISLGAFFVCGSLYDLCVNLKAGGNKEIVGPLVVFVFSSIWVAFVVGTAIQVVA